MAKMHFKKKKEIIKFRLTNGRGGVDIIKNIPLKLSPLDEWDNKLQLTKNNLELNKELLTFKHFVLTGINNAIAKYLIIDKAFIERLYLEYYNPNELEKKLEPTLLEYSNELWKKTKSLAVRSKIGSLKYKLRAIPSVKVKEADLKWMNKFVKGLLKNKYAESTINKHIQLIRQIIRYADQNDLEIKKNILSYPLLKTSSISYYLDEDELDIVFNHRSSTRSLDNVRKLFLIGCTTGLRISDLMRIKNISIKDNLLMLTAQKTRQLLAIPIDPRVKDYVREVKPLAHPVFNRFLKDLFKEMQFKEMVKGYVRGKENKRVFGIYPKYKLISSHTMRRSFASNLYGKIPTIVIMAITGHTTEKSFLTYIKKPQYHFAEQLQEYYNQKHNQSETDLK